MYTVPAKVPNKAKDLIATYETGEAYQQLDQPTTNGETVIAATNGEEPTSPGGGAKVRIRMSREVSVDELAQPGTARRLLQEFETKVQQAVAAGVEAPILRNPEARRSVFRQLRSSVAEQQQQQEEQTDAASPVAEAQPAVNGHEQQCNGCAHACEADELAVAPSTSSLPVVAAAAEEAAAAAEAVAAIETACNSAENQGTV